MVNKEALTRNERIIRKYLEKQIAISLEMGNKYIDKELSGIFYVSIKPIVKLFYNTIKKKDMASGTKDQISIVLDTAKTAVLNPEISLENILNKRFKAYLSRDQTDLALKKTHTNYRWCRENLKNTFRAQVEPIIDLLKCETPDIKDYYHLCAVTFKTKENCMKVLLPQQEYMNKGMKKVGEDLNILNLPVGRDILYKVLRQGYSETWRDMKKEIQNNPYLES
ncbi:MAG: hypothetical protein GY870_13975 [archaeon]|nr:hypothetical protein [archaeon]